ncbi:MAG: NYN domain-containing protein [Sphingomonadales bacterium]|nr:NYN domain-containing protein [Sphingomonadales bacterium]MDE2570234.1 NYN domain-containing protein [Sphingomonadales bacterium]
MDQPLKNIALLIDADNASPEGIDAVLTALAKLGQVNIRRIYGNWEKRSLGGWRKIVNEYGLAAQQQFDLTKGKNATDMAMTIDAMDLLYQGKVDGYGIMSSDSDFTPLATRLRQDGLVVYGFGTAKTPAAFQTACTRFLAVEKLIVTDQRDTDEAVPPANGVSPIDRELIDLLGAALKAARRDEQGYARLSEVGQIAGNRSSFDVRNYGYKRLSDLMKAASDWFKVEQRADKHLYVRRLR